jgi:hypothetical protein
MIKVAYSILCAGCLALLAAPAMGQPRRAPDSDDGARASRGFPSRDALTPREQALERQVRELQTQLARLQEMLAKSPGRPEGRPQVEERDGRRTPRPLGRPDMAGPLGRGRMAPPGVREGKGPESRRGYMGPAGGRGFLGPHGGRDGVSRECPGSQAKDLRRDGRGHKPSWGRPWAYRGEGDRRATHPQAWRRPLAGPGTGHSWGPRAGRLDAGRWAQRPGLNHWGFARHGQGRWMHSAPWGGRRQGRWGHGMARGPGFRPGFHQPPWHHGHFADPGHKPMAHAAPWGGRLQGHNRWMSAHPWQRGPHGPWGSPMVRRHGPRSGGQFGAAPSGTSPRRFDS